ncbi:hypothetical protein [Streptacidiphilus sp. EB129]|uniref:hypothetical protein n=1 Tax=Streptacidiphilus sp. EB129 TaxID=3156262 RepID=UPI00351435AE
MVRGRLTEYHPCQAAKLLHVTDAQFAWARHAKLIPPPDASEETWLRATVEAMDAAKIVRALPEPVTAGRAADLIAASLGIPNPPLGRPNVKTWTVERFVARGLLLRLSWSPCEVNPAQVAKLCLRKNIWDLIVAETPLGPDQSAARLGIRRSDWDHIVRLGWIRPKDWQKVQFGTSKAGAVDVPIYRGGDVDAIPGKRRKVDWEELRSLGKGRRSPLAKL